MDAWAMVLDPADAWTLGRVRLMPGLQLGEVGDSLWLRGTDLKLEVARLPARERYRVVGDQLYRQDGNLPVGVLPACEWQSLSAWLTVKLGGAVGLVGGRHLPASVAPELVRGGVERRCVALRVPLATLADWVALAPARRLAPLRYAVNESGEALVTGQPSPPLAGQRYWTDGTWLIPMGWEWQPALPSSSWRRLLRLAGDDLALAAEEGSWERVEGRALLPLTRRGVRLALGAGRAS